MEVIARAAHASDRVVQKVFNAVRWAPSPHDAQLWRFRVIRDVTVKRRLAEDMASEWKDQMLKDGPVLNDKILRLKRPIKMLTDATLLIVALLTMDNTARATLKEVYLNVSKNVIN